MTLVANTFGGNGEGGSSLAIAIGSTAWLSLGAIYLVGFWSLADQTPGMRFVGIRLEERLPFGRSVKRLVGLGLSILTSGIGFLGVVFGTERRAWDDRLSGVGVVYDERQPAPAPWSGARSALPSDSGAGAGPAG